MVKYDYGAIVNQIETKFINGYIKNITFNTICKQATYGLTGAIIGSLVSGISDATGITQKISKF